MEKMTPPASLRFFAFLNKHGLRQSLLCGYCLKSSAQVLSRWAGIFNRMFC